MLEILAATGSNLGFDPLDLISTVVTPVMVVILLITGQLVTKGQLNRLEALHDAEVARMQTGIDARDDAITGYRTQIDTLQTGLVDKAIPAITLSTEVIRAVTPYLQTGVRVRPEGP